MTHKPLVIVTRKLPRAVEAIMESRFNVELNADDAPFGREGLLDAVRRADILLPTVTDILNHDLLTQAGPRLKLIANYGAGINHIDLSACRDQGIVVSNTPDVLTEDTADIAIALILGVMRKLRQGERLLRQGEWTGWSPTGFLGAGLSGKRLAIIGAGRIGRAVARRAAAFGMEIDYHNRTRLPEEIEQELSMRWRKDLDAMLISADIVSIHCPATPSTYHLLDQRRLRLLRPEAVLINTARGDIVDEGALIRMLEEKALGGAGLDVYQNEPALNPRFLELESAMLLPHIASATIESREAMGRRAIDNIEAFIAGKAPPDRVTAGTV